MLVLICANDLSKPRIQPYRPAPKGVPKVDNTRFGAVNKELKHRISQVWGLLVWNICYEAKVGPYRSPQGLGIVQRLYLGLGLRLFQK